jgi:hypothetical protein
VAGGLLALQLGLWSWDLFINVFIYALAWNNVERLQLLSMKLHYSRVQKSVLSQALNISVS